MDNLFEDYMAARCTIKNLRRTIDEFKSGERYRKLQKDYHLVAAGYIKYRFAKNPLPKSEKIRTL